MNRENRLIKNTIIYMIGSVSSKVMAFLMMPLLTRYLSKYHIGFFDLILNTMSIVIPLITLCTINSIFRFVIEESEEEKKNHVISNGIFIMILGVIISLIPFLIISKILSVQYNSIMIILLVISTIAYNTWQQITRAFQKNVVFAISGVVFTISLFVVSFILIIFFHLKIEALIVAYTVAPLISFFYIELKSKIIYRINFACINYTSIKDMIKYSLPLIPSNINWWLMQGADRYIITIFLGVEANGLFSVASKFPAVLAMVNNIFDIAWTESAIMEFKSKDRDDYYSNIFNIFMRIQFSLFFVCLPIFKYLLWLMVGNDFKIAWIYIPALMIGLIFSSFADFYGTGYLSSKNTMGAFTTTTICGVLNIVLDLILIKFIGLHAAAIASAFSFLFLWIIRAKSLKNYFNVKFNVMELCIYLLIAGIYIIVYYFNKIYIDIIFFTIAIIISYNLNKKIIKQIFQIAFKYLQS